MKFEKWLKPPSSQCVVVGRTWVGGEGERVRKSEKTRGGARVTGDGDERGWRRRWECGFGITGQTCDDVVGFTPVVDVAETIRPARKHLHMVTLYIWMNLREYVLIWVNFKYVVRLSGQTSSRKQILFTYTHRHTHRHTHTQRLNTHTHTHKYTLDGKNKNIVGCCR